MRIAAIVGIVEVGGASSWEIILGTTDTIRGARRHAFDRRENGIAFRDERAIRFPRRFRDPWTLLRMIDTAAATAHLRRQEARR